MIRFPKQISIFLSAVFMTLTCCSCSSSYITEAQTVFSSGIVFTVSVMGGKGRKAIDEMFAFMEELDASVNANRPDSLLSRFNALKEGESIEVDYHAYKLAEQSQLIYYDTKGAFNPALVGIAAAWGVDTDGINRYAYGNGTVTQPPSLPSCEQLSEISGFADMNGYKCYTADGKYYLKKLLTELKLDFGGIAKGYCADRCREIAIANKVESALIKVSGNVVLVGDYFDGKSDKPWGVGVINPRRSDNTDPQYVCGFYRHGDATIVTSGDYERCFDFYYEDGSSVKICHIIAGYKLMPIGVEYDETTGKYKNSESYVISATVIGENSMLADAYSTAVCVMGAEEGAKFLDSKGYDGIIFTSDKKYITVGNVDFTQGETLYLTDYQSL